MQEKHLEKFKVHLNSQQQKLEEIFLNLINYIY